VSNHKVAISNHENGDGHKDKVEAKLKAMRNKSQQALREQEQAQRAMAGIEAAAQKAYSADLAGAVRPEDTHGPVAPSLGPGARARLAEEAERRATEATMDAALKRKQEELYRATAGARDARAAPEWHFDAAVGYQRDVHSGFLYDNASGQYFNPSSRAWGAQGPEEEEEEEYLLSPFAQQQHAGAPPPPQARPLPPALSLSALHAAQGGASQPRGATPAHLLPRSVSSGGAGAAAGAGGSGTVSAFQLGFGTNHPAYEASRAKTSAAASRAHAGAGGASMALSGGPRGLGAQPHNAGATAAAAALAASKRKAAQGGGAGSAEAEALARREAARKRVEARTMGSFGLG